MKIGDSVRSTGKGKTKSWGNYIGKIVQIKNNKIYVLWGNTSFEDEMSIDEVELLQNPEEVIQLKFSDGMIIHTHGSLRVVEFSDGWYVVGEGKLIAVGSEEVGLNFIHENQTKQVDKRLKIIGLKLLHSHFNLFYDHFKIY
jgi:hypothetical protein